MVDKPPDTDYLTSMVKQCYEIAVGLSDQIVEMKVDPEIMIDALMATLIGVTIMMDKEDFLTERFNTARESLEFSKVKKSTLTNGGKYDA